MFWGLHLNRSSPMLKPISLATILTILALNGASAFSSVPGPGPVPNTFPPEGAFCAPFTLCKPELVTRGG